MLRERPHIKIQMWLLVLKAHLLHGDALQFPFFCVSSDSCFDGCNVVPVPAFGCSVTALRLSTREMTLQTVRRFALILALR